MLSLVQVTLKISFICCHSTPNNPFRAEEVIDSSWKTWCSGIGGFESLVFPTSVHTLWVGAGRRR